MKTDGRSLEQLISYIEGKLLPPGFSVTNNSRIFNDDGEQLAEFDIEITGFVGSTFFSWLIECRDREGSGAAPGSWIEQLIGRKDRFGFNKVTAVSTTGFSASARDAAERGRIELRSVTSVDTATFSPWLKLETFGLQISVDNLVSKHFSLGNKQPAWVVNAAKKRIDSCGENETLFLGIDSGYSITPKQIVDYGVSQCRNSNVTILPNAPPTRFKIQIVPSPDDRLALLILGRTILIARIELEIELSLEVTEVPLSQALTYDGLKDRQGISQTAVFASHVAGGTEITPQVHHLESTGEVHFTAKIRKSDA